MIDNNSLLNTLRINGVSEKSTNEEVDKILSAFFKDPNEKQQAVTFLQSQGWLGGNTTPSQTTPANMPGATGAIDVPPANLTGFGGAGNKPHSKVLFFGAIGALIVLLGAGVTYGFVYKIGPFSSSKYTESNFLSSLLSKASKMESGEYRASGLFNVGPRDADAKPFVVNVSNSAELRQLYQEDSKRVKDISSINQILKLYGPNSKYGPYPPSLSSLIKTQTQNGVTRTGLYNPTYRGVVQNISTTDPTTNKPYEYTVTDGGKNFNLSADLAIDGSVNYIRKSYQYAATNTPIVGKKVTLTKNSPSYLYVPSQPPEPFFVQLEGMTAYAQPDMNASGSFTASADWSKPDVMKWMFNVSGEGSFGDLSYKANIDALRDETDYYFKINNLPSFFFGMTGIEKGKWVKIPSSMANAPEDDVYRPDYTGFSYLSKSLPKYEKSYKEGKEKFVKILTTAAKIADEEKLVYFKSDPKNEKVEGRLLTKYELGIHKDAIVPFYTKLIEEMSDETAGWNRNDRYTEWVVDQGLLDYLKSQEFSDIFDYYDKNTHFTFWVDQNGFPAILEQKVRIIPPDKVLQFKDKQLNIVLKLIFSKINETVDIKAPADSVSVEKLMENANNARFGTVINIGDTGGSASSGSSSSAPAGSTGNVQLDFAQMKANMSAIRAMAEIAYDKNNSYGLSAFTLGSCSSVGNTIFSEPTVFDYIYRATGGKPATAACASTGTAGKITAFAVSAPVPGAPEYSWCVDSIGNSKQIRGTIRDAVCN